MRREKENKSLRFFLQQGDFDVHINPLYVLPTTAAPGELDRAKQAKIARCRDEPNAYGFCFQKVEKIWSNYVAVLVVLVIFPLPDDRLVLHRRQPLRALPLQRVRPLQERLQEQEELPGHLWG